VATKRKPYVRVARSILTEPWDRESKLALVLLQCHMANRWATDQLTAEEACHTVLAGGVLGDITGSSHKKWARHRIDVLGELVSMSVTHRGDFTEIYWPKLAEYQGWDARERAEDGDDLGSTPDQSAPAPSPAPDIEKGGTIRERGDAPAAPLPHPDLEALATAETENPKPPDWAYKPALLHAISKYPGTPEAKKAFVDEEFSLMGLEVMKDPKLKTKANKASAMGALTIRYYRAHLSGARPSQISTSKSSEGVREREAREVEEFITANAPGGEQ
jgi:hypothetical protein